MSLVLKERKNPVTRETSSFKVVRVEDAGPEEAILGLREGEYTVLDGNEVSRWDVEYVTYQHNTKR